MTTADPSRCIHPTFYYNERFILDSNGKPIDKRAFICCTLCNQAIFDNPPKSAEKKSKAAQPVQKVTDPKTQEMVQKLTNEYQKFRDTLTKEVDEKLNQIKPPTIPPTNP